MCYSAYTRPVDTELNAVANQDDLKGSHDTEDQRAYLCSLQRHGLPEGEAAGAGYSQNLSGEVRSLCGKGKDCGRRLKRP